MRARLGPELATAVRLAALLGLFGALGPFGVALLQVQLYSLVIPTGSLATAAGLGAGFGVAAAAIVGLSHLRELALLTIGNRLVRRLSLPALRAATARGGAEPAAAAATARYLRTLRAMRPPLDGNDLRQLGVAPGPGMGRLLEELRAASLDGVVTTRGEAEAWVLARTGREPR